MFHNLSTPDFLRFDPVPVRARRDGWTPARQRRFILELARGSGPHAAARSLGLSRQTAYALRGRRGAEGFAAAWDAALAFAERAGVAGRAVPPGPHGLEAVFVPRFYRGRLVGYVVREDHRSALRQLALLDCMAAEPAGGIDLGNARSFSELVERATGDAPKADKADEISA
jgi:hypothetical protein